ncbi:amino acid ABC transporter permease [Mycolicibacterium sp.]|uniref:amino acid ABC transporter permease n=1 Tax=Mycolicibacterium sp. TaxID=2320850 RepID=UPI003D11CB98
MTQQRRGTGVVVVEEPAEPVPTDAHHLKVARKLHPSWWVMTAILAVLAAMLVNLLLTNENLHWDVVGEYFFSTEILTGLLRTIELTVIAMVAGIVLGSVLAVMRLSRMPLISGCAWLYIWLFRGTPLLVQIIFWFNLALLIDEVSLGVPFGPQFVSVNTNELISPLTASIIALSLCEAAYMAEIIRGGLQSIDAGQSEASRAIGLTPAQTLRYVIYPQAMRVIIPPTGNEVIGMLKTTSLVSVIALPELLYSAQLIYAQNFLVIPLLIVASLWYLLVCTVLMVGQYYIERHFGRGAARALPPTPMQRWRRLASMFLGPLLRSTPTAAPGTSEPGGRR